jgi:hypothetical protein
MFPVSLAHHWAERLYKTIISDMLTLNSPICDLNEYTKNDKMSNYKNH